MIEDSYYIGTSIDFFPDRKAVAISHIQGFPIYFYDLATKKITRKIEVSGYYAGPKIRFNKTGNYLLLQQQFYIDYKPNVDREVQYEVMDVASGNIVFKVGAAHNACFNAQGNQLICLEGNTINFYELPSGKKITSWPMADAANAIAASADGSRLFVAHMPNSKQLQDIPVMRNDKKAIKPALKYRNLISVYEIESGILEKTIPEIYDIIFQMELSDDDSKLLVYSKPHTKFNPAAAMNGYVSMINTQTFLPERASFMSRVVEPDFKDSPNGHYFAMVSQGKIGPQLQIWERETGKMYSLYDVYNRMGQAIKDKEFSDGRAHFLWLDNDTILILYGNYLTQWNIHP
jgi:hypothetical protein